MLVCQKCHEVRQDREHQESQPLQFTEYQTTQNRPAACPSCDIPSKGARFEYLSAYELIGELQEAKERIEALENTGTWRVPGFYDAAEMLHAIKLGNQARMLQDPEIMLQVLEYAAECGGR